MQYMLSNKVSFEEMQRVLERKSNQHEITAEFQTLNNKVEDIYKDVSKRLQ